MRHPATFMLTVLLDEHNPTLLQGRACLVSTGEEITFTKVEELVSFLWSAGHGAPDSKWNETQVTRGELELEDEPPWSPRDD